MIKNKFALALIVTATFLITACSETKAPGKWTAYNLNSDATIMSVNFVNESVGWINCWKSIYGRPGQDNTNGNGNGNANSANRNTKPKKPGDKAELEPAPNEGFVVLQTKDGGQNWSEIPDLIKNKIRSVWFVDALEGWALTIERGIVHTTDGGQTWTLLRPAEKIKAIITLNGQPTDVPEQLENIRFSDNQHGWAWGGGQKREVEGNGTRQMQYYYPGTFLVTLDGGQNWSKINYPFEREVVKIFFLNFRYGWANVAGGGFYKTSDGGLTWAKVDTKLPQPLLRAIFFVDENAGWVVDGDGRIAKTTDSGRTWKKLYDIKDEFKMNDIFFTDASHGWAVGENGAILYTTDGESIWFIAESPVSFKLTTVAFPDKSAGWITGQNGVVLRYQP